MRTLAFRDSSFCIDYAGGHESQLRLAPVERFSIIWRSLDGAMVSTRADLSHTAVNLQDWLPLGGTNPGHR